LQEAFLFGLRRSGKSSRRISKGGRRGTSRLKSLIAVIAKPKREARSADTQRLQEPIMSNNTLNAGARLRVLATAVALAAASFSVSAHAADTAAARDATAPVTHASLMKELSELRAVGYDLQDDSFPESLQRAERKLESKRRAEQQATQLLPQAGSAS